MIAIIFLLYLTALWLVYFRLRLLPFNLTNKIAATLGGFVIVFGLMLTTNYSHPHSSDVRVVRYVVPISSYLTAPARVVDVPVRPNTPVKKGEVLFRLDSRPYEYEVQRLEAALVSATLDQPKLETELKAAAEGVTAANAILQNAKGDYTRGEGLRRTGAIGAEEYADLQSRLTRAESNLSEAAARRDKARLALDAKVSGEFTSVAQVRQQLAAARLNVQNATVTAPDDGFVTDLAIRPGLTVGPAAPVLAFVSTAQPAVVVATYSQNPLHHVEPGQRVEVVFAVLPGRVLKGEVETIIPITGQGQVTVTGDLPELTAPAKRGRFAVRLALPPDEVDKLPAGAAGSAVIYTQTLRPLGAIQKMTIRMEGYLNYLTGF